MESKKRRALGRYDTPRPLSQALVDWAVRRPWDEILEPSSGCGVFVASVIHRLQLLGQTRPHQQIWACDIDHAACVQTARSNNLNAKHVWNADFLSLVDRSGIAGRKFDCVVGNPPYISLHRMLIGQRRRAVAAANRLGFLIDKKASLWAYFAAAATQAMRDGGRLAFILPESILHADYARGLLRAVGAHFTRCILLSIRERCFAPDGAAERVVMFLGQDFRVAPGQSEIFLRECVTAQQAAQFLEALSPTDTATLPRLTGHAVAHFLNETLDLAIDLTQIPSSAALSDFAEIKIGIVTGANEFFLLTEPERKQWKLPLATVVPLIPRFQVCKGLAFRQTDWEILRDSGEKCWLLSPSEQASNEAVLKYLRRFPKQEREDNRTFGKRNPWYLPQLGENPDAFFRYMGAFGPRLALVRCEATCTNTVHRIYFKNDVSVVQQKTIALSLHSSFSQLSAEFEGRAYGSGVLKLEPSEAKRVRLLLPNKFEVQTLYKCFSAAEKKFTKGKIQEAAAEIDDWLYTSIPPLNKILPLPNLRRWLKAAVERRVGYPQILKARQPIKMAEQAP